jgi:signal transduction histidine kinase
VLIIADSLLLTQALETLLFNAITYADPDGALGISLHPQSQEDDKSICIQIAFKAARTSDLDEHMAHVFEPFFRATEGDIAGSQVSMAIAKEIIDQHGGNVIVEPDADQGYRFRVRVLRAPNVVHTPAFTPEL